MPTNILQIEHLLVTQADPEPADSNLNLFDKKHTTKFK